MAEKANTGLSGNESNNMIQLSNVKGTPMSTLKLNSNDLNVFSRPVIVSNNGISLNTRTFDVDGIQEKIRIANFIEESNITLYGDYPQNSVSLPKYDLSNIIVVNDPEVSFSFILSLRENDTDATPKLYATSKFYNLLLEYYSNKNPIPVNDIINEKNIISINLEPLKEKIESLRTLELGLDINLTDGGDKKYVEIIRNLFANSNYTVKNGILKAEPTYDLIYLLRYISWVVSKPSQNYNDRLLSVSQLGQINKYESNTPTASEPSTNVTNTSNSTNNTTQNNTYPPIGRKGIQDEEEVFYNGSVYTWNESNQKWELFASTGAGGQGFKGQL